MQYGGYDGTWKPRMLLPYRVLLTFLLIFAISTVTMETLLASTLVRSNGISAMCMRTALVFVWSAFIQIFTVFHLAMITSFAFASETSWSISTHGATVFFTISLRRLKQKIMLYKINFTPWTQCIEGALPSFILVSVNHKIKSSGRFLCWNLLTPRGRNSPNLQSGVGFEYTERGYDRRLKISCPLSPRPFTHF